MKRVPPAGLKEESCHIVRGSLREPQGPLGPGSCLGQKPTRVQGPQSSNNRELGREPRVPERTGHHLFGSLGDPEWKIQLSHTRL